MCHTPSAQKAEPPTLTRNEEDGILIHYLFPTKSEFLMDEKYVDEAWKESVADEKKKIAGTPPNPGAASRPEPSPEPGTPSEPPPPTDISFAEYLSSLVYQAMIFLGETPHPATNENMQDLRQAKIFIDTLVLLRHKTKGNLTKQEADTLNTALYELQMRFVELVQKEGAGHD